MNLELAILQAAVAELGHRTYGHAKVNLGDPWSTARRETDCSITVAVILTDIYGPDVLAEWAALMIQDPSQPFSPIAAVERLGIGRRVDSPEGGRIHLVQGWRVLDRNGWVPEDGPRPNGHSFLWRQLRAPENGSSYLINANTRRPCLRRMTWGEARGPYRAGVELAVLRD